MQHDFYRRGARRRDLRSRGRFLAILDDGAGTRWSRTTVDLRHQLKGSSAAVWCLRIMERFGVERQTLDYLAPVMFHIEALVYRGDLEYERAQQNGGRPDSQWRDGIDEILRAYAVDTPTIRAAVDELDDYFGLETDILAGRTPLEPDLIERTCYTRCSGAGLLLRIGCALAGIDPGEGLFTLVRHLSAHDEISTDLPTYADDLTEGMFNVYRLADWIYGGSAARRRLELEGNAILRALQRDIARADRAALILFAAVVPPIAALSPRIPSVLPRLLPRTALALLLRLRVQFHSVTKPLRFPELLDDTRPGEPRPDVGERVLGRVAAMTGG